MSDTQSQASATKKLTAALAG